MERFVRWIAAGGPLLVAGLWAATRRPVVGGAIAVLGGLAVAYGIARPLCDAA